MEFFSKTRSAVMANSAEAMNLVKMSVVAVVTVVVWSSGGSGNLVSTGLWQCLESLIGIYLSLYPPLEAVMLNMKS